MFSSVERILGHISGITPLPPGGGARRQPPRWLKPGDRAEVEIEEIGPLSDQVAA